MRKTQISIAVAALFATTVAAAGGVTVTQNGTTGAQQHIATWNQLPANVATLIIDQDGAAVNTADVQQTAAGVNHSVTVRQDSLSGAVGNDASVIQRRFDPDVSTVLVDQVGEGLSAQLRTLGQAGSTAPNDYSILQTGINNDATVDSVDSSGDDVTISQGGEDNSGRVQIVDSTGTVASIDQVGLNNEADIVANTATNANLWVDQSGNDGKATINATGLNASGTITQTGQSNSATLALQDGDSSNIVQGGDNGVAVVDFNGGSGTANINQDGDDMEARVNFLSGASDIDVTITQLEDDNNVALVQAAANATDFTADVTQTGDDNRSQVLISGGSGGDIDITQADTNNLAIARSIRSEGVDIDINQSANGDDGEAEITLRDSTSTVASITQEGNDQSATVVTQGDDNGSFVIDQSLGQNQANVEALDSSDAIVSVDQDGRDGSVIVDLQETEGVNVNVVDGPLSFQNEVDISLTNATNTGVTSTQNGENNQFTLEVTDTDIGSVFDVVQSDDDNTVFIESVRSSSQDVDISQGPGDSNTVLLDLDENTLTKININQTDNDNLVDLAAVQDRGSVVNITQADDGNVVDGQITESRFALDITQGNIDGDNNLVRLGTNNRGIFGFILNANETDVDIVQNGNDNVFELDIFNDFSSDVQITQTNAGIGHLAFVNLEDTNNGSYIIDQLGGNNNTARIDSFDNLQSTATITQLGGENNIANVVLGDGDDFVNVSVTQTNCLGCVANGNAGNTTVVQ